MLIVKDKLYYKLIIDGFEYPLEQSNFGPVMLCSSPLTYLPMGTVVISDNSNFFGDKITLADGMQVTIVLGPNENEFTTYDFRIWSFKQSPAQGTTVYELTLVYNAMRMMTDSVTDFYEGTSAVVMRALAGEVGLRPKVDATDDYMIWLPRNQKFGGFANFVCDHGYISDLSGMVCGTTIDGQLRYKDITQVTGGIKFTAYPPDSENSDGIYVLNTESVNVAGFSNTATGYRHKTVVLTTLDPKWWNPEKEVFIKKNSQFLMLNKAIKAETATGRVEFTAIDCGNVHPHYERARYQNVRQRAAFNLVQKLTVNVMTGLDLFDPLIFTAPNQTKKERSSEYDPDNNDSGQYVVTGKAVYANEDAAYYERLLVMRHGLNDDPSGTATQE